MINITRNMTTIDIDKAFEQLKIGTMGEIFSRIDELSSGVEIVDTRSKVNCYMLKRDVNGNYRLDDLIDYIEYKVLEYSIPKDEIDSASEYLKNYGSPMKINALQNKAKKLFTELKNTGEGGEILLYILTQEYLKIPQLLSKMSLKTSSGVHYHGADGIHFNIDSVNNKLDLYWAESKMYADLSSAISSCFESIKSFLLDPQGCNSAQERDLTLITSNISHNINNKTFEDYIVRFFDKDDQFSNQIEYKGICFIGFDSDKYPSEDDISKTHAEIRKEIESQLDNWYSKLSKGIKKHTNLELKEIHIFLMPFRKVEDFRDEFLKRF